jgi:hypothetical protein
MLTLFDRTYAKNDAEFIGSLFNTGGTCNGYYAVKSSGIYLSDMQGKRRAFIRRDGLGPVSIHSVNGRTRYMFAVCTQDEGWLNVPDSYSEQVEGARELACSVFA